MSDVDRRPDAPRHGQYAATFTALAADGTILELDDTEGYQYGTARLDVDTVGGTLPTLDVYVQTSYDGGDNWIDVAAFTQATAAADRLISFGFVGRNASATTADVATTDQTLTAGTVQAVALGGKIRIRAKVGGTTPTFTGSVQVALAR